MLTIILNLLTLLGLLFGAGYVGSWVTEYECKRKSQNGQVPLFVVGNIGFFSGASGGGFVLLLAVLLWWNGLLYVHIW